MPDGKDIDDWRARIDEVDDRIVGLINERLGYAIEIGELKRASGRQIRDRARERALIERLQSLNQGPLSEEAIADVFARIMAEARILEGGGDEER